MACSETWKEQEVQERFRPFRPTVPTLTPPVLEVVLPKLCRTVPLVPCAAVTALAASQAAERARLDSPLPSPPAWEMGPAVFNRHARVCSRTCGRWMLCSAPLSFCLTFSCSGSSVPCFRWELLQPSVLYRAPSDCHVLGEWVFSAWLQHLSRSPHLT